MPGSRSGTSRRPGFAAAPCVFSKRRSIPWRATAVLVQLPAKRGTPEAIERRLLIDEIAESLSAEERHVYTWKKAGFSSQEIARYRGTSVAAVDTMFHRAKQKARAMVLGAGAPRHARKAAAPNDQRQADEWRWRREETDATHARRRQYDDRMWRTMCWMRCLRKPIPILDAWGAPRATCCASWR